MFESSKYDPPLKIQILIKNLLIITAYLMNMTFILAIACYPEKYRFFSENISKLGGIESVSGSNNFTSMLIMMTGFGICGLLTLATGILYLQNKELYLWKTKATMSFIISFGAFIIIIPHDFPNLLVLHGIGAVLFIGGFAAFNTLLQISSMVKKRRDHKEEISKPDTTWDIILSIIVSILLVGYFIIFPIARFDVGPTILEQTYQKVVIFTALLALYFIDEQDI